MLGELTSTLTEKGVDLVDLFFGGGFGKGDDGGEGRSALENENAFFATLSESDDLYQERLRLLQTTSTTATTTAEPTADPPMHLEQIPNQDAFIALHTQTVLAEEKFGYPLNHCPRQNRRFSHVNPAEDMDTQRMYENLLLESYNVDATHWYLHAPLPLIMTEIQRDRDRLNGTLLAAYFEDHLLCGLQTYSCWQPEFAHRANFTAERPKKLYNGTESEISAQDQFWFDYMPICVGVNRVNKSSTVFGEFNSSSSNPSSNATSNLSSNATPEQTSMVAEERWELDWSISTYNPDADPTRNAGPIPVPQLGNLKSRRKRWQSRDLRRRSLETFMPQGKTSANERGDRMDWVRNTLCGGQGGQPGQQDDDESDESKQAALLCGPDKHVVYSTELVDRVRVWGGRAVSCQRVGVGKECGNEFRSHGRPQTAILTQ